MESDLDTKHYFLHKTENFRSKIRSKEYLNLDRPPYSNDPNKNIKF
jgi:hypothetical protein